MGAFEAITKGPLVALLGMLVLGMAAAPYLVYARLVSIIGRRNGV